MGDYFRNLNTIDPLFHAIVVSKLKELQQRGGDESVSVDNITEEVELEILREYCVKLYKEYRTLRTVFLEHMVVTARSVGFKYSKN